MVHRFQPLEDGNMALIGYSPWQDAAAYGAGLGQTLGQAALQLPQEKFQLAQNAALMQQRNQLAQQGMNIRNEYNQGRLGLGQQRLDTQNQNESMANQIRMLMAQLQMAKAGQGRVEGGYFIPGVGGGQPQMPQQQDPQMPQQGLGQQQQGLPGGIIPLPRQSPGTNEITQNQIDQNRLKALSLWGQFMSSTNPAAQWGQTQASNMVVNPFQGGPQMTNALPQGAPQQQQTNKVWNYNPATGQLE